MEPHRVPARIVRRFSPVDADEDAGHLIVDREGMIVEVCVKTQYRRQGIATLMYDALIAEGIEVRHNYEDMTPDGEAWASAMRLREDA